MFGNLAIRMTPLAGQAKQSVRNFHSTIVQSTGTIPALQSIGVLQRPGEGSTRTVTVLPGQG